MPKFFVENCNFDKGSVVIEGADALHISKALRMKSGDLITICDCRGYDYSCRISDLNPASVTLEITERRPVESEPFIKVTLFQGLPKGEKMDIIVQKSVELGVYRVVPVLMARSVSRPDAKSAMRKTARWKKIAAEAAKQSGRGILPEVCPPVDFKSAAGMMRGYDRSILFYEHNGGSIAHALKDCGDVKTFGIMVGPEGGFDDEEVEFARTNGILTAGMGPRILRTETAPLCALSAIMYATGNL